MISFETQNSAGGSKEAMTRKTNPRTTTIRPDSQTKRKTAGTLRSAETRSRHPPRISGWPFMIESPTRAGSCEPPLAPRNDGTQVSVETAIALSVAESDSGEQGWSTKPLNDSWMKKLALRLGRKQGQPCWSSGWYFTSPARCIPRCASAVFMKVLQTNPVRRFSAISSVIPVSMPITSVSYQLVRGLKAFTKPYLLHADG